MNAHEVIEKLKSYFAPPAYCFLEQVANGTGARQHRWADGVAMSVWPSRGYDIHGIEVKVARYDWVKELANLKKSEAVQQYCNRWWIATPDTSFIKAGELPPTWGWMVCTAKGMKVVTPAPALTPKAISVEFLASILRNVCVSDQAAIESAEHRGYRRGEEAGNKSVKEQYAKLLTAIKEFEAASGIHLSGYEDGKHLGESVRTLRDLRWKVDQVRSGIKACEDVRAMLVNVEELATLQKEVANESTDSVAAVGKSGRSRTQAD